MPETTEASLSPRVATFVTVSSSSVGGDMLETGDFSLLPRRLAKVVTVSMLTGLLSSTAAAAAACAEAAAAAGPLRRAERCISDMAEATAPLARGLESRRDAPLPADGGRAGKRAAVAPASLRGTANVGALALLMAQSCEAGRVRRLPPPSSGGFGGLVVVDLTNGDGKSARGGRGEPLRRGDAPPILCTDGGDDGEGEARPRLLGRLPPLLARLTLDRVAAAGAVLVGAGILNDLWRSSANVDGGGGGDIVVLGGLPLSDRRSSTSSSTRSTTLALSRSFRSAHNAPLPDSSDEGTAATPRSFDGAAVFAFGVFTSLNAASATAERTGGVAPALVMLLHLTTEDGGGDRRSAPTSDPLLPR